MNNENLEQSKEPINLNTPAPSTVTPAPAPIQTSNAELERLRKENEAFKAAEEKRKQDELAAQGRFQEVIAEQQRKIEAMTQQHQTFQTQSEALASTVKQRIEALPEEFKPLMNGITDPVAQLNQLTVIDGIVKKTQHAPSPNQLGFVHSPSAPVDFQAQHQQRVERNRNAMMGIKN